jgi:hypothetical protein
MKISDEQKRRDFAEGEIANIRGTVLTVLEEIANDFTGKELSVSIFSSDGDVFHQCADCILQVSAQTHYLISSYTSMHSSSSSSS